LLDTLVNRRIAGAGIDVFEQEPTPANNPLLKLDNIVVTPHHICLTDECINTVAASVFSACRDLAHTRVPKNVVNQEVLGKCRISIGENEYVNRLFVTRHLPRINGQLSVSHVTSVTIHGFL
jgi:D-3-phosphoglycerate dehydrogenase